MFHLRGKKIMLALFIALVVVTMASAQRYNGGNNYNYYNFEKKAYYFGITLGRNTSSFKPYRSKEFLLNDTIIGIEGISGPGFNLGIVTNLKIGDFFDFRFTPTLSFAERNIRYDKNSRFANFSQRSIEQVLVEMPFQFRYKSAPYRDFRLFVTAGVKYAFDVASDSRTRQADNIVKIAPNDFALEYGAGIQFFFPYFIFSPEFKMSHGIGNILIYNDNIEESTVLDKILSRTFTISLHFEG